MSFGLLSLEISLGEKNSHPPIQLISPSVNLSAVHEENTKEKNKSNNEGW